MRFACLLVLSCAVPRFSAEPHEIESVTLVWDCYGQTSPPPEIAPLAPDCHGTDLYGAPYSGLNQDGACLAGWYSTQDVVYLAWTGSWGASALAHELMHAAQARRGVSDPDHKISEDWQRSLKASELLWKTGY